MLLHVTNDLLIFKKKIQKQIKYHICSLVFPHPQVQPHHLRRLSVLNFENMWFWVLIMMIDWQKFDALKMEKSSHARGTHTQSVCENNCCCNFSKQWLRWRFNRLTYRSQGVKVVVRSVYSKYKFKDLLPILIIYFSKI